MKTIMKLKKLAMIKKKTFLWLTTVVILYGLIIQTGCKKDKSDPDIKKYVWAVGSADSTNYALIYFSDNGGENWVRQGEGQEALQGLDLNDVWAVDENTVWAVAQQNVILKTTAGGANWFRVPPPTQRTDASLSSISIIGKTDIWISGNVVYHSTDGGNNWTNIQSPVLTNTHLQGINAISDNVIYAAGGKNMKGFIVRTTDGGQTWDSIVPPNNVDTVTWIGVTSTDADNIVVYGGTSHYTFTTNGGQTWTNGWVPDTGGGAVGGADINDLTMLDSQTWWGAFDYDGIFKTNNAGSTWNNQGIAPGPKGMWLVGIDYYDKDLCVIVGTSSDSFIGKIIRTSDGGQLWELCIKTDAWMKKVSFIK